jgi:hypothetical protein
MRFFRHRPFALFLGILASALPALAQTGFFQGSASTGPPSAQPLSLSLDEALKKGLRYNLGAIDAAEASDRAKMCSRSI